MTKCYFKKAHSGKLVCIEHNEQALIYVYSVDYGYRFICQIGEDELIDKVGCDSAKEKVGFDVESAVKELRKNISCSLSLIAQQNWADKDTLKAVQREVLGTNFIEELFGCGSLKEKDEKVNENGKN